MTTPRFWQAYADVPPEIKLAARKQYQQAMPEAVGISDEKGRAIVAAQLRAIQQEGKLKAKQQDQSRNG